jgi:hypothetical protein
VVPPTVEGEGEAVNHASLLLGTRQAQSNIFFQEVNLLGFFRLVAGRCWGYVMLCIVCVCVLHCILCLRVDQKRILFRKSLIGSFVWYRRCMMVVVFLDQPNNNQKSKHVLTAGGYHLLTLGI